MSTHVGIPKPLLTKIEEERKATGLTMSEIVRRALDLYFKEKERKQ